MDDAARLMRRFGWTRREAETRLALVAQAEARLDGSRGMDWYAYTYRRGSIRRQVIRPMSARRAEELGAVLVPDFDPSQRIAGIFVVNFPPEGELESGFPIEAEAPAGRL